MINFSDTLLAPIYTALGNDTTYTLANMDVIVLNTIDKTAGIEIQEGPADVQTVRPAAVIRMVDIAALSYVPADFIDATLVLNGVNWQVKSYFPKPSPNGEADGELYLLLNEAP